MKNVEDVLKFIEKNKSFIGFGNYQIHTNIVCKLDCLAKIDVDEYSQKVLLTIPKKFFKHSIDLQNNILLHELIHGRESLRQQRVDCYCKTIMEQEEEKCMNDITTLTQRYIDNV
jgi:hypothetical protein